MSVSIKQGFFDSFLQKAKNPVVAVAATAFLTAAAVGLTGTRANAQDTGSIPGSKNATVQKMSAKELKALGIDKAGLDRLTHTKDDQEAKSITPDEIAAKEAGMTLKEYQGHKKLGNFIASNKGPGSMTKQQGSAEFKFNMGKMAAATKAASEKEKQLKVEEKAKTPPLRAVKLGGKTVYYDETGKPVKSVRSYGKEQKAPKLGG